MLHQDDNDFYRGVLLEHGDTNKGTLDIGFVEKHSIGRTEDQELAVGVAGYMGVNKLRWVRAHFEREMELRWNC
jgi:hypothetical protein